MDDLSRGNIGDQTAEAAQPFSVDVMWCHLELVYPPLTNREALDFSDKRIRSLPSGDPVRRDIEDVKETLESSDFYFIGARSEMFLDLPAGDTPEPDDAGHAASPLPRPIAARLRQEAQTVLESQRDADDPDGDAVALGIDAGGDLIDSFVLHPSAFRDRLGQRWNGDLCVELGEKGLRVLAGSNADAAAGRAPLLEWFTTDKLIFDRSRGVAGIEGLDEYRRFATYDLLYVGIAKSTDTFARLFTQAHRARQEILGAEESRHLGAHVTDETVLFAFRLVPTRIRVAGPTGPGDAMTDEEWLAYVQRVKLDAEKAFISLLRPKYNEVQYEGYPLSVDGLWVEGHDAYAYGIAENMTFVAPQATIRGARGEVQGLGPDADLIVVERDRVSLTLAEDPDLDAT